MKHFLLAGLVLGFALLSRPAEAAQVFDFVARVDQANSLVAIGTQIEGQFAYDEIFLPTNAYDDSISKGTFFDNPSIFLTVRFNGNVFSNSGLAGVNSGPEGSDFYIGYPGQTNAFLYISDPLSTFIQGINLPTQFPVLAQGPFSDANDDDGLVVPHGELRFFDVPSNNGFNATVLSITPGAGAVPEPETWAMLVMGFGFVGHSLRRRAKRHRLVPA